MLIWGLYLSIFWAITLYSILQDSKDSTRFLSSVENMMTSIIITFCVLGLHYAHIGETLAPFLIILLPMSAYFEISNALGDLKSERIQEQLDEDIPQDVINNIAFMTLSALLLPGYIAGLILLFKYGTL